MWKRRKPTRFACDFVHLNRSLKYGLRFCQQKLDKLVVVTIMVSKKIVGMYEDKLPEDGRRWKIRWKKILGVRFAKKVA